MRRPAPPACLRPSGRTRFLIALLLAAALVLLAAPSVPADTLTPESGAGSKNADDIDALYKITFAIGIVIFLIVEGTLIWALVKYRARRGAPEPAQIRGNTPLEMGWTIAAGVILVVLAIVTFIYLPGIRNPPASDPGGLNTASGVQYASVDQPGPPSGRPLEIEVNGQQYLWRYDYPGREALYTYYEMVVPTKTTVTLKITSSDVAHSWWIPKLGGKKDAIPNYTNKTWFKVQKEGSYTGACTELCGAGHADMLARVRAVPPDEFMEWAARQRAGIKQAQEGLAETRRQQEAQGAQGAQ